MFSIFGRDRCQSEYENLDERMKQNSLSKNKKEKKNQESELWTQPLEKLVLSSLGLMLQNNCSVVDVEVSEKHVYYIW